MNSARITDVLFDEPKNQENDSVKSDFLFFEDSIQSKKSEKKNNSKFTPVSFSNDNHEMIWSTKHNNVNSNKSFSKDIRKYLKNSK
jgi:hypothetical protein